MAPPVGPPSIPPIAAATGTALSPGSLIPKLAIHGDRTVFTELLSQLNQGNGQAASGQSASVLSTAARPTPFVAPPLIAVAAPAVSCPAKSPTTPKRPTERPRPDDRFDRRR